MCSSLRMKDAVYWNRKGNDHMAKMTIGKGADDYINQLQKLVSNSDESIRRAVYDGAHVVADEIRNELQSLPVTDETGRSGHPVTGVTAEEKDLLTSSFGLSRMQNDNGFINTKAGVGNKRISKGKKGKIVSAVSIAREVESGSSFRKKLQPFSKGARKAQTKAEEAMRNTFDQEVKKDVGNE